MVSPSLYELADVFTENRDSVEANKVELVNVNTKRKNTIKKTHSVSKIGNEE
jgi:hypothetical protein